MIKMLLIFVVLLIVHTTSESHSKSEFDVDYDEYNEILYKKYIKMDTQLKLLAENSVKKLIPYALEVGEHVNISASCTNNLFHLITGFRKLRSWSFKFFDAMGKLQSGILAGNIQMFGEYEECIETVVMKNGKVDFQGKYCMLSCKPYLPKVKKIPKLYSSLDGLVNATKNSSDLMKLFVSKVQGFYAFDTKVALCVPSGCSKRDVFEIIKYSLGDYINCTVSHCLKDGDIYFWTIKRSIIVSVFVLFGVIVLLSTWCDNTLESWKSNKLGFKSRMFLCFSLTRNFPKLMNTSSPENSITCLNGIRVLTIFWIILSHEYFFHSVFLSANHFSQTVEKMLRNFFSQIVLNGFVSVDVFFFVSGFVNCYSRMRIKQTGKSQPSFLKVIIHRLWRIYPAFIAAFLIQYLLFKPQPFTYTLTEENLRNCDMYFWQNFLFIMNFFDPLKTCLPQTWFISVDMQLFLLTLFTIPVLLRKPKIGLILHVGMILVVNLCSMSWWLVHDLYPATLDPATLAMNEAAKRYNIYRHVPVHLGPYFIGILLGYVISTKKDIKIPKITQFFGWLAASILFTSMIFMTLRWNSGNPYTQFESSLYGAWSRTIMILGFSWLVFSCATGHAALINYILSLKLWVPLSRLTYMLYLVSPLVQTHNFTHLRFPDDMSDRRNIWNFAANTSISILMCTALVVIVESPMIALEKVLFGRKDVENKSSSQNTVEKNSNYTNENGFENNEKFATTHI